MGDSRGQGRSVAGQAVVRVMAGGRRDQEGKGKGAHNIILPEDG